MSQETKNQKPKTSIDFANLQHQHNLYKEEIEEAILKVARDCNFIMGSQIDELERNLEKFTGSKYAISCSSGTDALLLAMMALDIQPDDEITDAINISDTNWDIEKLKMSDKNSCIKLEIKKNQNVVSIDLQVDSAKDSTICKKIRDSGLVSKVYEVY